MSAGQHLADLRQRGGRGPCDDGLPGSHGQRGCSCADGNRGSWSGGGCWAGKSAWWSLKFSSAGTGMTLPFIGHLRGCFRKSPIHPSTAHGCEHIRIIRLGSFSACVNEREGFVAHFSHDFFVHICGQSCGIPRPFLSTASCVHRSMDTELSAQLLKQLV